MKIEEKGAELVITDFDELEAYKIARKIEKDGREFYEKLYESVSEPKVKETLGFLKREEGKHLAFFEEKLDQMREKKEDYFEEDDILDSMEFGIYKPYQQDLEKLEDILNNVKRALKLGIKIEERSINFYKACKEKVASLEAKDQLQLIIEEETKHKARIEEHWQECE